MHFELGDGEIQRCWSSVQTSSYKINKFWYLVHSTVTNVVTVVNNTVLYTWVVVKRVDLKCSHYKKKKWKLCEEMEVLANCYGDNHFAVCKFIKSTHCAP